MTPAERHAEQHAAWKRQQLAKAGPLTQEQQAALRRILLSRRGRAA